MKWLLLALAIFAYMDRTCSVNILCLMPVSSPSHHIWNKSLMEALAARGHNMTIVSPDVEQKSTPNMHYIHLEEVYPTLYNGSEKIDIIDMANQNHFQEIHTFYQLGIQMCEGILKSKGLATILNYPKDFKFDLVLHDFTCGPCLLGVYEHFNAIPPLVAMTAFLIPPQKSQVVGGHNYPSYIPYFSLSYDKHMNFIQRVHNVVMYAYDLFYRYNIFLPKMDVLMKRRYGDPNLPYVGDIDEKTVLMLVNSHESTEFPEPISPNVIPVGGLHIKEPKTLPKDLEDFVQQGKKGAVLFSLGSNVRSDMLDLSIQKMFVDAFRQIPEYNFLWKFESDLEIPLPKNVIIRPWMPQNDILGHSKVKGFITHGGGLSTQESSWHNVPMIGIPFICDQYRNLHKSVQAGVATQLVFQTLTTEKIKRAILEVLQNPSYRENMAIRSRRFRDQKEKPLERAVWWVEWILRNHNPEHLQSPVVKLGFIAGNCLDVYLFFIVSGLLVVYSLRTLYRRLIRSNSSNNSPKKLN